MTNTQQAIKEAAAYDRARGLIENAIVESRATPAQRRRIYERIGENGDTGRPLRHRLGTRQLRVFDVYIRCSASIPEQFADEYRRAFFALEGE